MSLFKRALGAVGEAGVQIANKYIDEDLAQARAKALADLQYESAVKMEEYRSRPDVQARARENAREATLSTAAAADEAKLRSLNNTALNEATARAEREASERARQRQIEDLTNPALRGARDTEAADSAKRTRDATIAAASDKEFLKSQEVIARSNPEVRERIQAVRAQAAAASASRQRTEAETRALNQINELTTEQLRVLDDPKISDEERKNKLANLQAKLAILNPGKGSSSGGVKEEITDTVDPSSGKVLTRERKTIGPLGAASAAGGGQQPDIAAQASQQRAELQRRLANGEAAQVVKELESLKRTPAQIVALIGEEKYAEVKGTGGARSAPTAQQPAPTSIMQATGASAAPATPFEARRQTVLAEERQREELRRAQEAAAAQSPEARIREEIRRLRAAGQGAAANNLEARLREILAQGAGSQ